jgi:hypothetical protein
LTLRWNWRFGVTADHSDTNNPTMSLPVRTPCSVHRYLTAFSAVEDAPYRKVFGERFESVLDSRGDEQQIACFEGVALAIMEENASATNDDVDFVLRMWSLFVRRHGEGKLYVAGAPL